MRRIVYVQDLDQILQEAQRELTTVSDIKSIEDTRVQFLGKKGRLTDVLKSLGKLSPEERPIFGQKVNEVKEKLEFLFDDHKKRIRAVLLEQQIQQETLDITLPGKRLNLGT